MKKFRYVAALAVAFVSASASAQMISGNKLHEDMQKDTGSPWAFTRGYVAGVHDAHSNLSICAPASATLGQMGDMVKTYLENNAAVRHLAADAIVLHVLSRAWPCAKKGSGV